MKKKMMLVLVMVMTVSMTACDGNTFTNRETDVVKETASEETNVVKETASEEKMKEAANSEETIILEETKQEDYKNENITDIENSDNVIESEKFNVETSANDNTVDYESGYDEDLAIAREVRTAVEMSIAVDMDTYIAVTELENEITVVTLGAEVLTNDDILDIGGNGMVSETIDNVCVFSNTALKSQKALSEGLKIVVDTDINVKIKNFAGEDVE